ncbi:MAG: LysR family transcriptional regulator [Shewanella sp.]|nr:MAG: LysR family transcriptional regulator [Shewanella sp.]
MNEEDAMDIAQRSRVNINLLVTLKVLLKERSASATADRLNLSQSSISKNLSQLRHLFNDPLFHRTSHGLMPTPLALELEPKLSAVLLTMEDLFAPSQFDLTDYQGCFRISMQESAFEFIVAPIINKLLSCAPGMRLDTWFKDTMSLEQLNQGQLDFVILPHDVGQTPNFGHHLKAKELYRDNLACVVRKGHPALAHKWDQQAYLNYRHVHVRDKELGTPIFEQTLSEQGLRRNIAVQVPDFYSATSLCSQSDLIFTTTSTWAEFAMTKQSLVHLPMPASSVQVVYSLIWHQRSDADQAHRWLKDQIISTTQGFSAANAAR